MGKVDSENRFGLPKIPRKKKSRLFVISRRKVGQGATDEGNEMEVLKLLWPQTGVGSTSLVCIFFGCI